MRGNCGGGFTVFLFLVLAIIGVTTMSGGSLYAAQGASFAEFARKAENGEQLNVVFLGGSLTWGANASDPQKTSYRGYTSFWLREYFPKASFMCIDAAIGGTGSSLGIFRLERDVMRYKPDLVFLDYTVNDGLNSDSETANATYEALLREMVARGVPVVQVLLGVRDNYDTGKPLESAKRRACHLRLHEAYNTAVADTIPYIRALVQEGKVDLAANYPFENTHPDDAGYHLFFECARDGLLKAIAEGRVCTLPDTPVYSERFRRNTRLNLTELPELPQGWRVEHTLRTALWFDGQASRWVDRVIVFDAEAGEAQPLTLDFAGELVGLFGEGKQDALNFTVRIDGQPVLRGKEPEWKSAFSIPGNLFFWRVLAESLTPGKHTLEITPVIPESGKGQLRLGFVGFAGGAE